MEVSDASDVLDRVRSAVKGAEAIQNFLRALHLFNQNLIEPAELFQMVQHLLTDDQEFLEWFHDFLKLELITTVKPKVASPEPPATPSKDPEPDPEVELDYKSCKKVGASYRRMPFNALRETCSGRTPLCHSVLNDTYFSCPDWLENETEKNEHRRRRNLHENALARVEDERYEMDMAIELNSSMITVFEHLKKRMAKMDPDTLSKFKLTNRLGGRSRIIFRRLLQRMYGRQSTVLIKGLKTFPAEGVGRVLTRLKLKAVEWRELRNIRTIGWADVVFESHLPALTFTTTPRRSRRT